MIDLSKEINNLSIIKLSIMSKNINDRQNDKQYEYSKLKTEINNLFLNKISEESKYFNLYNPDIFLN